MAHNRQRSHAYRTKRSSGNWDGIFFFGYWFISVRRKVSRWKGEIYMHWHWLGLEVPETVNSLFYRLGSWCTYSCYFSWIFLFIWILRVVEQKLMPALDENPFLLNKFICYMKSRLYIFFKFVGGFIQISLAVNTNVSMPRFDPESHNKELFKCRVLATKKVRWKQISK